MFYYHKGTQLNKGFTTSRAPNYTNAILPQWYPTKQMFYYNKGTQLNYCFTTTSAPN